MDKSAVLHIPLSQYAYAEDEHTLVVRLRVKKGDLKTCFVYYGDRVDQNKKIRMKEIRMEQIAKDGLFDYYEAKIKDVYTRICYYFLLDDGAEKEYYYERNFCKKIDCDRTEYFQFPYIRREDIIAVPEWVKNIVMYHIFPDSFATGKRYLRGENGKGTEGSRLGGTLSGILENLDWIESLGVNCLYLNPVFTANSYHKYDTTDYFSIDPSFGTKEDLKELVDNCHKRGIRVILDGVFNHCGPDFFAFKDVLVKGKKSTYYDWFYYMPEPVEYCDPPSYEAFAYVKEMPKLNTGNKEVEEYFCKVGTYWIKECDIDGWRLDVANEINHDFWRNFRKKIKEEKEDAFLIGEIWEDAGAWLLGDQFDSTMNYTFSYLCRDFFAEQKITAEQFDEQIQRMILRYPKMVSLAQMNLLDSHDVPRFLSYCDGDRRRLKLALFYLFTGMGVPSVFYGDEYYIEGTEEPEYRAAMPWGEQDNCGSFLSWLSMQRKTHRSLREGDYRTVFTDNKKGIYAFYRQIEQEKVLVILNNSNQKQECVLPAAAKGRPEKILLPAMEGKIVDCISQ